MVKYVRSGYSYRFAARRWKVSVSTVAFWVGRATGQPLAKVNWQDLSRRAKRPYGRTQSVVIRAIFRARRWLKRHDALGEHGPAAIRRYLLAQGIAAPCERTIARWLAWSGMSGTERWRHPPPPKGWYLPEVAAAEAELDSCDIVEGLCLRGAQHVEALNILSLWGAEVDTTTNKRITTQCAITTLQARWRRYGRPVFLQCDNDTVFTGAHARRNYLGRLVHWCLCMGVVPVFAPPGELGFQAAIEAYNRLWQERVWRRWRHPNLPALQQRSDHFVAAYTTRRSATRPTHPLPRAQWEPPAREPKVHRIVLIRRLDEAGTLVLCAQHLRVHPSWANRLVRCEVDTLHQRVRFYGLRRRHPNIHPLLRERSLQLRLVPWHQPPSNH